MSHLSPEERIEQLELAASTLGLQFNGEDDTAYLPRAVSTVSECMLQTLDQAYDRVCNAVKSAGLTPQAPFELGEMDAQKANPLNDRSLLNSRMVIPLAYAASAGRGWESGFSYGRKLIIPVLLPGQKINAPTIRRPYQIPVILDQNLGKMADLFRELSNYEIGFGDIGHGPTVIGYDSFGRQHDLREIARKYVMVVDWKV